MPIFSFLFCFGKFLEEVHPDNTMDKRPTMIREHCPSFIIENIDPIIDKVSSLLDEIVFLAVIVFLTGCASNAKKLELGNMS